MVCGAALWSLSRPDRGRYFCADLMVLYCRSLATTSFLRDIKQCLFDPDTVFPVPAHATVGSFCQVVLADL